MSHGGQITKDDDLPPRTRYSTTSRLGGFAPLRVDPIDLALVHGPKGESDYFAIPDSELAARSAFGSFHDFGTEHVASAIFEILDQSDAVAIHLVNSSPAFRLGSLDNLWRQNSSPTTSIAGEVKKSGRFWRRAAKRLLILKVIKIP